VGIPYHWGRAGLATGDSANELLSVVLDNNVHISEYKVLTCDVIPGRRPRGPALAAFVEEYRRRSGVVHERRHTHE
jgi:formate dehydrogenase major subunit